MLKLCKNSVKGIFKYVVQCYQKVKFSGLQTIENLPFILYVPKNITNNFSSSIVFSLSIRIFKQ